MSTATMTSKGQMTVPKAIRQRLRIGPGDRVDFIVNDDGDIVVRSANSDVRELRGMLRAGRTKSAPATVEAMNAAILKAHTGKR